MTMKIKKRLSIVVDKETREVINSMTKDTLNKQADQLGMPRPENITEAWRLKQLLVAEARRESLQIDNDTLNGLRIPIENVSDWLDKVFIIMDTALKRIPSILDNMSDIPDEQKFIIKKELNAGIKEVRKSIADMEIS